MKILALHISGRMARRREQKKPNKTTFPALIVGLISVWPDSFTLAAVFEDYKHHAWEGSPQSAVKLQTALSNVWLNFLSPTYFFLPYFCVGVENRLKKKKKKLSTIRSKNNKPSVYEECIFSIPFLKETESWTIWSIAEILYR